MHVMLISFYLHYYVDVKLFDVIFGLVVYLLWFTFLYYSTSLRGI